MRLMFRDELGEGRGISRRVCLKVTAWYLCVVSVIEALLKWWKAVINSIGLESGLTSHRSLYWLRRLPQYLVCKIGVAAI